MREDAEYTTVIESSYYVLRQVLIPEELLCVWPQESAGNNSCHAGEIPDRASCLQRVSGQGRVERTRGEKKGKKRKHDD